MSEFTEEEMAGLSEEERAAIMDEVEDSIPKSGESIGDQDTEGDDDGAGNGEGDTSGAQAGGGTVSSDPGHAEGEGEPRTPPAIPFVPVLPVDTSRLEGISTQLEELNQQLQDGDLDLVEYTKLRDPLIREQTQIELTQHFNEQQQAQLWKHEQNLFFSRNDAFRTDPILNGALRAAFKQLDTEENDHKTGYDLLLEAKTLVDARFGSGPSGGTAANTPTRADGGQSATPRRSTPARDSADIPKTLAEVIPASSNSTNADEFAHLDNLTGLEYEQALAKLPKDAEERYLRGA